MGPLACEGSLEAFSLKLFCFPLGKERDRVGSASNLFSTTIPVDVEVLDIEDSRV